MLATLQPGERTLWIILAVCVYVIAALILVLVAVVLAAWRRRR